MTYWHAIFRLMSTRRRECLGSPGFLMTLSSCTTEVTRGVCQDAINPGLGSCPALERQGGLLPCAYARARMMSTSRPLRNTVNTSRGMPPSPDIWKLQSAHIIWGAFPSREVYRSTAFHSRAIFGFCPTMPYTP